MRMDNYAPFREHLPSSHALVSFPLFTFKLFKATTKCFIFAFCQSYEAQSMVHSPRPLIYSNDRTLDSMSGKTEEMTLAYAEDINSSHRTVFLFLWKAVNT